MNDPEIVKRLSALEDQFLSLSHELTESREDLIIARRLMMHYYYKSLSPERYPEELTRWYERRMGQRLDLENPRTFNEKIQWLKLYDSTPLKSRLVDKVRARPWVAEKIGEKYLIPRLGQWKRFEDIDFNSLPSQFILKTNHGSGWNVAVTDKNRLNLKQLSEKFDRWLRMDYAFATGLELCYANIEPVIVAEEFLDCEARLFDYRIMCFGGQPWCVWVDGEKSTHYWRDMFDLEWNHLEFTIGNHHNAPQKPSRPVGLEKMLSLAHTLSAGFAHSRVDFFESDSQIYFAEITFYSESGFLPFYPEQYDLILGELINLPDPVFNFVPKHVWPSGQIKDK